MKSRAQFDIITGYLVDNGLRKKGNQCSFCAQQIGAYQKYFVETDLARPGNVTTLVWNPMFWTDDIVS